MIRKIVTRKLWNYGVQWTTQDIQRTSMQAGWLRGTFPSQDVTGNTPDISEYLKSGFYDHVSYKENAGLGMTAIRRWLGLYHRVDRIMSYWILTQKGTVISRTTVQRLNSIERDTDEVKASVSKFDT